MSQHDSWVILQQMRDYAMLVLSRRAQLTRHTLDDEWTRLAVIKSIENIGEAARRLDRETQALYPEIRWSGWIGMRNRLAHGYDVVDLDTVWEVLCNDIPVLIEQLDAISERMNKAIE